ncbi:hypothetical protein YTPLAS72_01070 [Nitrospira sp.]|nr:hypothetical protein YTPLAS72_01070 [Nitrospira sp.]
MKYQTAFDWNSIMTLMLFSLVIGASVLGGWRTSLAADVYPSVPATENRKDVPPDGSPVPPDQRPTIDPGIVVTPPAKPHPDSVVDPPVLDPEMSIHPQDAPTTEQPARQTPLPANPPERTPSK